MDAIDLDGFGAAGAADGTAESQLGGQLQAAAMAAAALLGGGIGPERGDQRASAARGPSHRYHYVLFREDGAALGRVDDGERVHRLREAWERRWHVLRRE